MNHLKSIGEGLLVLVAVAAAIMGIARWISSVEASDEVTAKLVDVTAKQQDQLGELFEDKRAATRQASIFCRAKIWPRKFCDTIELPSAAPEE